MRRRSAGGPAARLIVAALASLALVASAFAQEAADPGRYLGPRMPDAEFERFGLTSVEVPGGELRVAFAPGPLALPRSAVLAWVASSARVVAAYYGRFPAVRTRLLIVPRPGAGVGAGKAWAHRGATLRIAIGEHTSPAALDADWVLVHEMIHLAFPAVADRHNWIHEGLATYVEPVARAQAGRLSGAAVWAELAAGLPRGLPGPGDEGLDRTPTWGRTYWGGALFALLAEVEIRRRTANRFGLQQALRAILETGNMETASALEPLLQAGDRAVGAPVLIELYAAMKDHPHPVDLAALWQRLGVRPRPGGVELDDAAPEAHIRRAITVPLR